MDFRETLRVALKAIRRNKVRSTLTMLGVIIGVASVIAMIALGSGARAAIDEQIESQGTSLIYLSSGSWNRGGGGVRGGSGTTATLTMEDAVAVSQLPGVSLWTPVVRGRAQVVAGNQNWNTSVEGGNEDYVAVRSWVVADGANFTTREVLSADKVCLLGATVARTLFPDGESPVGQVIRIKNLPFRVVGVFAAKGQGQWGQDQDDFILGPFSTIQKKLLGITYLHQVSINAATSDRVEPLAVQVTQLMRERHKILNPDEDDFSVRTVEEMAQTRVQMAQTMTGLLMSVASVSLLVGGIGIMNIMLVSVTERTKEIGLRMAVGARTRDILRQFLAEAVALSTVGGLLGTLLGVGVSRSLTQVLGWPTLITTGSIFVAFAFAAGVGVFFGYYPARTAAGLDPIDALRYE
jgi:putative ABC transport system permease protein